MWGQKASVLSEDANHSWLLGLSSKADCHEQHTVEGCFCLWICLQIPEKLANVWVILLQFFKCERSAKSTGVKGV